jgi:hypothetical protein
MQAGVLKKATCVNRTVAFFHIAKQGEICYTAL